jgi:hypothetical protein
MRRILKFFKRIPVFVAVGSVVAGFATLSTTIGVSNGSIDIVAKGRQYNVWRTLLTTRVSTDSPGEVIILNVEPPEHLHMAADKPYCIKLLNSQAGTHNQWQFRYLRDSSIGVAAFEMGNYVAGPDVTLILPVHLTAMDTPPLGDHTYTLQMRFVGDAASASSAQLEIQNDQLVATIF